jgi:uncharacterized protein YxeA
MKKFLQLILLITISTSCITKKQNDSSHLDSLMKATDSLSKVINSKESVTTTVECDSCKSIFCGPFTIKSYNTWADGNKITFIDQKNQFADGKYSMEVYENGKWGTLDGNFTIDGGDIKLERITTNYPSQEKISFYGYFTPVYNDDGCITSLNLNLKETDSWNWWGEGGWQFVNTKNKKTVTTNQYNK